MSILDRVSKIAKSYTYDFVESKQFDTYHPPEVGIKQDPILAKYYSNLELPYDAPIDQIKINYRRLVRQYHPDLFNQDPEKSKVATQITKQLNEAYNCLKQIK